MTLWLKQSTAKVVSFGPMLDKSDGVTEETGLVSALDHATTGIKLSKNGGALTIRHATVTATTYDAYGNYRVTLDTTDTNTLGTLRMAFNEAATCLPVWQDFMILPANVYDSLVGGTDALDVSAIQLAGQTITAAAGVTFPTSVASPTNITAATGVTLTATTGLGNQTANITGNLSGSVGSVTGAVGSVTGAVGSVTGAVGSVTGAVGSVTGSVGSVAANGITATSIATDAINALSIKADAVTKIQNGLATPTNITAGTITTVTNLTNLPAAAALEATLTAMKGATFAGATDSLEAIRDRGDAAWATATGFATPTNITAGTITTVTNLTNAPTNGDLTATMKTSVTTAATAATPTAAAVTGAVGSVTGAVGSVTGSVGSVVGHTPQTGDSYARLGAPSGASIAADIANVPTSANNANGLLDLADAIDTGLTVRHALELAAGSIVNKLSGAGTATEVRRNFSDTADLATLTVDASGNVTAVTYDFSI